MRAGLMRSLGGVAIASVIAMGAVIAVGAVKTEAATLPDAVYYNAASGELPNGTKISQGGYQAGGVDLSGDTPYGHYSYSTSNDYSIPRISASAFGGGGSQGAAGANLSYFIMFSGAAGDISVHVNAAGAANASGPNILNGYGHNEASASVWANRYFDNGALGPDIFKGVANSNYRASPDTGLQTFSIDQSFTFTANVVYKVLMQAYASSTEDHLATAWVDPTFTAPAGYALLISSGIGNGLVATTPIPPALPLFAAALSGLGLLGWRRRKAAAV
jgi:hypothetical protein